MEETTKTLEEISQAFFSGVSEKERRLFAAQQSLERGYGGISSVHRQYGISINAIQRGRRELQEGTIAPPGRQLVGVMRLARIQRNHIGCALLLWNCLKKSAYATWQNRL